MNHHHRSVFTGPALCALVALAACGSLHAQVPKLISYQGKVAVGDLNFNGTGRFKFALVNADGSAGYWNNGGTANPQNEPPAAVQIPVISGLYSVMLGDVSIPNMAAIPAAAFAQADLRLRVWFDDGVHGSQLLAPDQRLAPAAYLADGAVTAATIADGSIVGAKLAPATLQGSNIAPGSLDFTRLSVSAAPVSGQVLGFNGSTLNWQDAAGLDTSTTGGANKIPRLDARGSLRITGGEISGEALISGNGAGGLGPAIYLCDNGRIWFLNTAKNSGGSIFYNTAHDANGGELQINSPNRIALCLGPNGALQIGMNYANSKQFAFLQSRGNASPWEPATSSLPLYFVANYWDGSSAKFAANPKIQAVSDPNGDTALNFYNPATQPDGTGGDGTATLAMSLKKDGLTIPAQTLTDPDAVVTRKLADSRYGILLESDLTTNHAGVRATTSYVDSGLSLNLEAGIKYEIRMTLLFTHNATGGVRFRGLNAGGLTTIGGLLKRAQNGVPTHQISVTPNGGADGVNIPAVFSGGKESNFETTVKYRATSGGLLKIQYAQNVSNAGLTVMTAGSSITATPISQ